MAPSAASPPQVSVGTVAAGTGRDVLTRAWVSEGRRETPRAGRVPEKLRAQKGAVTCHLPGLGFIQTKEMSCYHGNITQNSTLHC